jgi:hypothetical protein
LALAAGGSELGGSDEFELSIDSRLVSSLLSARNRSITAACVSISWSCVAARSDINRIISPRLVSC